MPDFQIKEATPDDINTILGFILELAEYEKLAHQVVISEAQLQHQLFEVKRSFCLLAFEDNAPVGFALYFYNFSTFLGRNGIYLEDLFIQPAYRGKGYGKQMLSQIITIAREQHCGRVEWSVLDWNQPAIDFYEGMGAKPMNEWTTFRMEL
jgi:GNAT superfamily N-acetyltransferase